MLTLMTSTARINHAGFPAVGRAALIGICHHHILSAPSSNIAEDTLATRTSRTAPNALLMVDWRRCGTDRQAPEWCNSAERSARWL